MINYPPEIRKSIFGPFSHQIEAFARAGRDARRRRRGEGCCRRLSGHEEGIVVSSVSPVSSLSHGGLISRPIVAHRGYGDPYSLERPVVSHMLYVLP